MSLPDTRHSSLPDIVDTGLLPAVARVMSDICVTSPSALRSCETYNEMRISQYISAKQKLSSQQMTGIDMEISKWIKALAEKIKG